MKGKENIKNIWRCMLVGVFVVSLFAAFTTEGLAEKRVGGHAVVGVVQMPQPDFGNRKPPTSPMMITPYVAVSMFNLEPPDPCLVCRKSVSANIQD